MANEEEKNKILLDQINARKTVNDINHKINTVLKNFDNRIKTQTRSEVLKELDELVIKRNNLITKDRDLQRKYERLELEEINECDKLIRAKRNVSENLGFNPDKKVISQDDHGDVVIRDLNDDELFTAKEKATRDIKEKLIRNEITLEQASILIEDLDKVYSDKTKNR